MNPPIEHVIVLMLENRSFDHMLGFLDHPNAAFEGLKGTESNFWEPGTAATVNRKAEYALTPGPDHSHLRVMKQLTGKTEFAAPYTITNSGFAWDFAVKCVEHHRKASEGAKVMNCMSPEHVPVLSTLALEFCVCDHWFCSVPGETWPNRIFALTGTSDGEVNIKPKPYNVETIFEVLESRGKSWKIFHDGAALSFVFPALWKQSRRQNFQYIDELHEAIRTDSLPAFSFVEPAHFGRFSNSQHPANNGTTNILDKLHDLLGHERPGRDFLAGEELIKEIYKTLRDNYEVFKKTLFVITYDEHGGFYDHVPPPQHDKYKVDEQFRDKNYKFDFSLLGPRVPAVLVSPRIARNTLDQNVYDHTSITASLRSLFAAGTVPKYKREPNVNTFLHNIADVARPQADLPDFVLTPVEADERDLLMAESAVHELDEFSQSLVWVSQQMEKGLTLEAQSNLKVANFDFWWDAKDPIRADIDTIKKADTFQKHVVRLLRTTAKKPQLADVAAVENALN